MIEQKSLVLKRILSKENIYCTFFNIKDFTNFSISSELEIKINGFNKKLDTTFCDFDEILEVSNNKNQKEISWKFINSFIINCTSMIVEMKQSSKSFIISEPSEWNLLKFNKLYNKNNSNLSENEDIIQSEMKIKNYESSVPESQGKNLDFTEIKEKSHNYFLKNEEVNEEPCKRIAPLKQLLQHSRTSEQMNDVFAERKEPSVSPTSNNCMEKQRLKKIARQQEQHQKAKDMAVEAARLRKERQSEMHSFDSFDSSRIIDKLFTDNNDDNYPDFSLFDAVHFNYKNKKPRKPRPLAQSTITGILPEGPPEEPELPKSPITTEKFRNQPFNVEKVIKPKIEINKEELAKYEPINTVNIPPPVIKKLETSENKLNEFKVPLALPVVKQKTKDNKKVSKVKPISSSSSSSSSSNTSSESLTSLSISTLSSSSSSTPPLKKRNKSNKKTKKKIFTNRLPLKSVEKEKGKFTDNLDVIKVEKEKEKYIDNLDIKTNVDYKEVKIENSVEVKDEESKIPVKTTNDMNVGTEIFKIEDRFHEIIATGGFRALSVSNNQSPKRSIPSTVDCHLNYQTKYKDNVLDRTIPLNIKIPTPNVSLSSFAQELNTQLQSLADTVDILLNRMEILEVNILDCSKYFFYR